MKVRPQFASPFPSSPQDAPRLSCADSATWWYMWLPLGMSFPVALAFSWGVGLPGGHPSRSGQGSRDHAIGAGWGVGVDGPGGTGNVLGGPVGTEGVPFPAPTDASFRAHPLGPHRRCGWAHLIPASRENCIGAGYQPPGKPAQGSDDRGFSRRGSPQ